MFGLVSCIIVGRKGTSVEQQSLEDPKTMSSFVLGAFYFIQSNPTSLRYLATHDGMLLPTLCNLVFETKYSDVRDKRVILHAWAAPSLRPCLQT